MNVEVKQTFTPVPMVSYRSSRKLSSYLVRAKPYPIERIVGSKCCGKKCCEVCVNVCETDTFTSRFNKSYFDSVTGLRVAILWLARPFFFSKIKTVQLIITITVLTSGKSDAL